MHCIQTGSILDLALGIFCCTRSLLYLLYFKIYIASHLVKLESSRSIYLPVAGDQAMGLCAEHTVFLSLSQGITCPFVHCKITYVRYISRSRSVVKGCVVYSFDRYWKVTSLDVSISSTSKGWNRLLYVLTNVSAHLRSVMIWEVKRYHSVYTIALPLLWTKLPFHLQQLLSWPFPPFPVEPFVSARWTACTLYIFNMFYSRPQVFLFQGVS